MTSAYKPFPEVSEWPTQGVDFSSLKGLDEVADQLSQVDEDTLRGARGVVSRLAAIETGKIEKLYDLDRGVTINAAFDGAILEGVLRKNVEKAHALIESQIAAYDSVLDFATGKQKFAEAWIRELHAILCEKQETYTAYNQDGDPVQIPLEKGRYKTQDNHVQITDGIHHYAPAIDTPSEMERFVRNVNSPEFSSLTLVDQAAYLHYAFVAIHPFPDGNGRVARALGSIPTYRNFRVPLLITADQREPYFSALAAADRGSYDDLRALIRDRVAASVKFLERSIRRAMGRTPSEVAAAIARNLVTKGGYSHVDIDEAGILLLVKLEEALNQIIGREDMRPAGVKWSVGRQGGHRDLESQQHRRVISQPEQIVSLTGMSRPPAEARVVASIDAEIPSDAGPDDFFVLECGRKDAPKLEIFVREVIPEIDVMTEMNIALFAEELVQDVGRQVAKAGRKALGNSGYVKK